MAKALKQVTRQNWIEFVGPNFDYGGYCSARYRVSPNIVELMNTQVPARVEALSQNGEWKQHPVIFTRYGSYEALKNGEKLLVMFLSQRSYTSRLFSFSDRT